MDKNQPYLQDRSIPFSHRTTLPLSFSSNIFSTFDSRYFTPAFAHLQKANQTGFYQVTIPPKSNTTILSTFPIILHVVVSD
jgi:hypothetical protein